MCAGRGESRRETATMICTREGLRDLTLMRIRTCVSRDSTAFQENDLVGVDAIYAFFPQEVVFIIS